MRVRVRTYVCACAPVRVSREPLLARANMAAVRGQRRLGCFREASQSRGE